MSPWVEERALAFAKRLVLRFSENMSTGCLGASKEFVDRRDAKCDGVRRGALLCRRSGVSVYAGFGDDDGPVAVHELTPIFGIAETFGKWQGRCESSLSLISRRVSEGIIWHPAISCGRIDKAVAVIFYIHWLKE
jgi:hypothetical protein